MYRDWIAVIDCLFMQYFILTMGSIFLRSFNFHDLGLIFGCEFTIIMVIYSIAFDSAEKRLSKSYLDFGFGLFLSYFLGIVLPFNMNRRDKILFERKYTILAST